VADPLADSRLGIEHAKRRIHELEGEIVAFVQSNPYTHVIETNSDRTEDVHKLKLTKPLPVALSNIAFEVLTHLRSSLDRAAYATALAAGTQGRDAKFPFGDTLTEVQSRIKRQSKDVPKEVFDVMVALQPYEGGNNLLWALNKLCNANKHEILLPMVLATTATEIYLGQVTMHGPGTWPPLWDAAKNEMIIMRVKHGHEPRYNLKFQFFVAIGQFRGVSGQPAVGILNAMLGEVERSLVAIEAEARRITLFV
jgi:hypothetical protein